VKILLDTHIFLWALLSSHKLSKKTIKLLEDTGTEKYLSAASSWEIAIKYAKGNLILPEAPKIFVKNHLQNSGVKQLPITINDTLLVGELPYHHRGPFDRLLITQARKNDMYLLTDDKIFNKYDVKTIKC
jgi:PIN domain nuclease of toxin-antitoxin system